LTNLKDRNININYSVQSDQEEDGSENKVADLFVKEDDNAESGRETPNVASASKMLE